MPVYDFRCDTCLESIEVTSPIFAKQDEERICSCGGKLSKVLHAPAISFKGDGFYKTDK